MNHPNSFVLYKVHLSEIDRRACQDILRGGRCWVWRARRAQTLLHMDQGKSAREAGKAVGVSEVTALRVAKRYIAKTLELALSDDERPGGKPLLDETQSSQIIAMVCTRPPVGRERWTTQLIATEAVKRGIVPRVGKETIRILLGCHDLKPWREKNVGHSRAHARVRGANGRRSGRLQEAA